MFFVYSHSGLQTRIPLSNVRGFYALKANPTFNQTGIKKQDLSNSAARELSVTKRSSFYHQSGLQTFLRLSNALRFTYLKRSPKPNPVRKLGAKNQVLDLKEGRWRLSVSLSTISPACKLCYRYRTWAGFTYLKPNPTLNHAGKYDRKPRTWLDGDLSASKFSSFYCQSG